MWRNTAGLCLQLEPELRVCAGWMQAYFMLDEMLIAGQLQEPSKKVSLCSALTRVLESGQDQGWNLVISNFWVMIVKQALGVCRPSPER
jgi:hypothetical protein